MTALTDLPGLDRTGLAHLWKDLFGTPVPANMSQGLQRRVLAYELQVRAKGDLAPALSARLARIASGTDRPTAPVLQPGGRLLRQWNGVTHVVDVTKTGYLWNGETHRSLSAIARAITGARWSGPRFFGLTPSSAAPEGGSATRASA